MNKISVFYAPSHNDINPFAYSYECVTYLAKIAILERKSLEDLLDEYRYPKETIKLSKLKEFELDFTFDDYPSFEEKYRTYKEYLQEIKSLSKKDLLNNLNKCKSNPLKFALCLDLYNQNPEDVISYELTWTYLFGSITKIQQQIEMHLKMIEDVVLPIKLENLFFSSTLINYLSSSEITTVEDLKQVPTSIIALIFYKNLPYLYSILSHLEADMEENYFAGAKIVLSILDKRPNIRDVIQRRYGFFNNGEKETLESIAKTYNVTRERIRQIESFNEEKITLNQDKIVPYWTIFLYKAFGNDDLLTFETLQKRFGLDKANIIRWAVRLLDKLPFDYSLDYEVLTRKGKLYSLVEKTFDMLPSVITKKEFKELEPFKQRIVFNRFSFRQSENYLKPGHNISDIYASIVDDLFPKGIAVGKQDLTEINKVLNDKYNLPPINSHALQSILARLDYCYIDRGTIINRKYAAKLPKELAQRIVDYIVDYNDVIYYTSIFEKFKYDLIPLGIINRYYLKGVLDHYLEDGRFVIKRDYIAIGGKYGSIYDKLRDIFSKSTEPVYLEDLKDQFPGVKNYVFINFIYSQKDIIWVNNGKAAIKNQNLNISKEFYSLVNEVIEDYLIKEPSEYITSKVLYELIVNKPWFNQYKHLIANNFTLFSILETGDDAYYYRRPYISKNKQLLSYQQIIGSYINSLDVFDLDLIMNYINEHKLRGLYSYQELMTTFSDTFVQVNIDTCVRKSKLAIDEGALKQIKHLVDRYLLSHGSLSMNESSDIVKKMPKLPYDNNKYFLIGIIRSYFPDNYKVQNTQSMYSFTDYIVTKA